MMTNCWKIIDKSNFISSSVCVRVCVSQVMLNSVSWSVYLSSDIKPCFKQCASQSSGAKLFIMQRVCVCVSACVSVK